MNTDSLPTLYPSTPDEQHRLAALARYDISSQPLQRDLEGLARLAQLITDTPYALINIIGREEQITVSSVGVSLPPIPREHTLCHHTVIKRDLLHIPDIYADPNFSDHPLVKSSYNRTRMYAGAPLITDDGQPLGAICVADIVVRELNSTQLGALRDLARQVVAVLELYRHAGLLARSYNDLEDFTAMVVRDVKAPISRAIDYAEIMADYLVLGCPLTGETLRNLHTTLLDSRAILEQLLSTTSAEHASLHFEVTDLNLLAEIAVDQALQLLPGNPTRVFISRLPCVEADDKLITHLFHTLIINAMTQCEPSTNPMVQISTRESGRGWVVLIDYSKHLDTGDADLAAAGTTAVQVACPNSAPALTPSEQVYPPESEPCLLQGLAACRRIVERHNGHLWLEDSQLGGSRVCFYLPASQPGSTGSDPAQDSVESAQSPA